jgi:hypothetical protein
LCRRIVLLLLLLLLLHGRGSCLHSHQLTELRLLKAGVSRTCMRGNVGWTHTLSRLTQQ